jgi:hypothetical protein
MRDGWDENDSIVLNEIRAIGNNSSLAYIFVKKQRDAELKEQIVKHLAAELTINAMGVQNTPEGEQAKKSMETRLRNAKVTIEELIERNCNESIVYLGGGSIVDIGNVKENIESALHSIADRQFPEFKSKADFIGWGQALTKAVAGNPDALNAIGFKGDIFAHPVATEILRYMGNASKQGKEIRNNFDKSPYGWSQDAIDTMIVLLKNTQYISTNEPNLIVAKINNATFKKEIHTLSATDKIAIKQLFQSAEIPCPATQEIFTLSNIFIDKLKKLAEQISGDAPRPEPVNINFLKDIENKEGNERLLAILEQKADLQTKYAEWTEKAKLVKAREPQWSLLRELSNFGTTTDEMELIISEINAIKENRLLLQEPDPIQPKLVELTDKLKEALNSQKGRYNSLYDEKMEELQESQYFVKLEQPQKHLILAKHQLLAKPEIKALDSNSLLNQLQKASLYVWDTKIAALSGQFESALDDAIVLSAPKATTFSLPKCTILNQADIDTYITELKTELEELLKNSSSIILK